MIEVEKKAYLRNNQVLQNIKDIAEYKGYSVKTDRYYGPGSKEVVNLYHDPVFRLRKENQQQILTFKEKSFIENTEVNQEHEIDLSHIPQKDLEKFFSYLGYKPFIDKNKNSHLYYIRNKNGYPVSIEHNHIESLGEFIEIEILAQQESEVPAVHRIIEELFQELGIKDEDIEKRYYIDLLAGRNNP